MAPLCHVSYLIWEEGWESDSHRSSGGKNLVDSRLNGASKMISGLQSSSDGYTHSVSVLVNMNVSAPAKVEAGPPHPVQPSGQSLSSFMSSNILGWETPMISRGWTRGSVSTRLFRRTSRERRAVMVAVLEGELEEEVEEELKEELEEEVMLATELLLEELVSEVEVPFPPIVTVLVEAELKVEVLFAIELAEPEITLVVDPITTVTVSLLVTVVAVGDM